MNFRVKESNKIFSGRVFDIKVDNIVYDSGNEDVREVIIHNGGAVVVPITDQGNIILVKQYRYPFNEFMLELPAGKLELGEDPRNCASRELTEETGFSSENINLLGRVYTSPGFCTEILYIYSANNLQLGDHNRDEGEQGMKVCQMSLDEVNDLISDGKIVDAKTISGIYYYSLKLNR